MSNLTFRPATKEQSRARVALLGTSGTGKTYTGLILATTLANGGKVAVIDSERGSASKYADEFVFDVCELETFSPEDYVSAIKAAEKAGYSALLIDSLTHAWSGKDGALEQVDKEVARMRSGNSFAAWRAVTPMHNALVDAMLQSSCHIIATMRSKTDYVLEDDGRGKKTPRKVGMAPIQRDGMEFEFDVVADMDVDHNFLVTKTRCKALDRAVIPRPDAEVGKTLLAWLSSGAVPVPKPPAPTFTAPTPPAPEPAKPKAPPKAAAARSPSAAWINECKSENQLIALLTEWRARDSFQIIGNEAKWEKVLDVAENKFSEPGMGGAGPKAIELVDSIREAIELSKGMESMMPAEEGVAS